MNGGGGDDGRRQPDSGDRSGSAGPLSPAVEGLVFGSGLCALCYQVVWLRELRLVFGASTAASSAVLAIFMGGIGLGSAWLGRQADLRARPLRFYGRLELMIAATAALTPLWMVLVRQGYAMTGGAAVMGTGPATLLRMVLVIPVIGLPTFLMGGTLPAVARAVVAPDDAARGPVARLYGVNTFGAVAGAMLSTFFMLEIFGTRNTLWMACLVNALVALGALALDRSRGVRTREVLTDAATQDPEPHSAPAAGTGFVCVASAVTGAAFFLMEMTWYRLLGPLLGGSTYTFGLILALALAGIGSGGALYAVTSNSRTASMRLFALTAALEAFFLVLPYGAGDRVAVVTGLLAPLGNLGLAGRTLAWTLVAGFMILPAAAVSGFQFPLLIGLLGRGDVGVGRDTGRIYAWNTLGAIAGALAGGFGLIRIFTATGVWKGVVAALCLLALAALASSLRRSRWRMRTAGSLSAVGLALALILTQGPTAAWRHSPIGAGRVDLTTMDRNAISDWLQNRRRNIGWHSDGIEASVGLDHSNGLAFVINGKIDGNAILDAPTQVFLGLVSAALHPAPRRAMVVGLGTGSSAGWLAEVAGMERVDVVELEPAIAHVARACAPVNRNAMDNPRISMIYSDAREVLFNGEDRYDLIVSEPSNPYLAGIASLYTREFYRSVKARLRPGGYFTQWVQAYEIDAQTLATIYGTLESVFPHIQTWQTRAADLMFICSNQPPRASIPALRDRLRSEPFRSALETVWGAVDLEGFLARFVANAGFASRIAQRARDRGLINTDDRTLIEFGLARTVGRKLPLAGQTLLEAARRSGQDRPKWLGPQIDWSGVETNRILLNPEIPSKSDPASGGDPEKYRHLRQALKGFLRGDFRSCRRRWRGVGREPRYPLELAMVGFCLADDGQEAALALGSALRPRWPLDADAILARLHLRRKETAEAFAALETVFVRARTDPWIRPVMIRQALETARQLMHEAPELSRKLFDLMESPLAVRMADEDRMRLLLEIGASIDAAHGKRVLAAMEPHVPWQESILRYRWRCYAKMGDRRADAAKADLNRFLEAAPVPFVEP